MTKDSTNHVHAITNAVIAAPTGRWRSTVTDRWFIRLSTRAVTWLRDSFWLGVLRL